ncbi:DUF7577 domain-containing protein [Halocatena pleomorpha]|uniref:DUF7577 domain-containing protein n=1 Tax=Halocatena pleomorpha TaxID=1785090 RepID=UPI001C8A9E01|nr:hypothetical protein [Halocatena pleomorpha]
MSTLVWGLLVLAVFPLLQIPILIYVARRLEEDDPDDDVPTPATNPYWIDPNDPQPMLSFDGGTSSSEIDPALITCPHCGTENDPIYTYCRNCVRRLPAIGWE